ncbi:hypothetical protein KST_05030 [Mycobacterium marinum]|nr:hypothetical protein KST_05030 [Mycobacterium marinum]
MRYGRFFGARLARDATWPALYLRDLKRLQSERVAAERLSAMLKRRKRLVYNKIRIGKTWI